MTTRDEQLKRLFLQSAIAARNTARAERDKAHELVRALTEETVEWRKQRDAARVELSFNRALVAKAGDDINRLLKDMLELEAERDAARAEVAELREEVEMLRDGWAATIAQDLQAELSAANAYVIRASVENIRLVDECEALRGELSEALTNHVEAVKNTDEARRWVDKLEAERDALHQEVGELKTQVKALQLSAEPDFSPEVNALVILLARQKMRAESAENERDALCDTLHDLQVAARTRAAERDILSTALAAALDWLENAPISYANGNVHNGMDEGDVLGGRLHEKLVAQLRAALNTGEVVREFPVGEFANNDHQ